MPPFIVALLPYISLASRAPAALADLARFWSGVRDEIMKWFAGGLITLEHQRALMDWAKADQAAALRGDVPVALTVEADPVTTPAPPV